jgi:hypothetical protein
MDPISIVMGLAQFAPQLIKWVTGNGTAERVAAIAVDVAQKVTGVTPGESYLDKLAGNAKLAAEFAEKIAEREHELTLAFIADTDSARKMQIAALGQEDVFSKRFVYYFAIGWSAFSMLFFCGATFGTVTNQRIADTILGFLLGTAIASIFQFFYGSTQRSQKKDETISKLAGK